MKNILLLTFLLPILVFSQKVKLNEYDKFIKQRRVELEPLTIIDSDKSIITLTFNAIGSSFYVTLSGFGWGASTIDANNELIFLLSNDSTVTVRSTGLQMYNVGGTYNSYKHKYHITLPDIEMLSRHEIVGIRKYTLYEFTDTKVSKQYAGKAKKLSSLFVDELIKGNIIRTLKPIDVANIAQHVGDSVMFFSKVYSTNYNISATNKPTILNVGANYPDQLLTAVILEEDRKTFGDIPEVIYKNKEVCIKGVVELFNDKPQIIVRSREQLSVNTPINLDEVAHFIGDSVTVYGTVSTVNFFSNNEKNLMFLNMGTSQASQLLTVIVEDTYQNNLPEQPEKFFINKTLMVKGRLSLVNNIPQITVNKKDQIGIIKENEVNPASNRPMNVSAVEGNTKKTEEPTVKVNRTAEFPGGAQAWQSFLEKNLLLPEELDPGKEGKTVIAQFVVSADGNISAIKIKRSAGIEFDNEVIKVLNKMPKWVPEIKDGQPVSVTCIQPITFSSKRE